MKIEQERMLVTAKGEAMGLTGETQDMVVHFEGRTMYVEGVVKTMNLSPIMTIVVDINTNEGKPIVNVTKFRLGGLPMTMLDLGPQRITGIINSQIESRGWTLGQDIESISIRDGKLIIEFKK